MIPLISIIIPTFNRAHIIGETLDSIIAQSYTDWECIIVDDGSTDDTEVVIAEYINNDSRFKFYKRPKHREKGPNSCRNFGFEKSKGHLIHWFDSDDLLFNNALELYLK
jgi:glycosyltransferase involved in cell wall biosynthesis